MTEDEMVGWHHRLTGHESEQTPGDSEGQGSRACYSPWGHKESNTTERLVISWVQSPSAVILEPKKKMSVTVSIFFPHLFAIK